MQRYPLFYPLMSQIHGISLQLLWPTAEDNCCLADCLLCFRIEYNKHNHQLSQKRNGGYLYAVCK